MGLLTLKVIPESDDALSPLHNQSDLFWSLNNVKEANSDAIFRQVERLLKLKLLEPLLVESYRQSLGILGVFVV